MTVVREYLHLEQENSRLRDQLQKTQGKNLTLKRSFATQPLSTNTLPPLDADELNASLQARDHTRSLAKYLNDEVNRAAKELPQLLADAKTEGATKAEEVLTSLHAESDIALASRPLSLGQTLARKYFLPQLTVSKLSIANKVYRCD